MAVQRLLDPVRRSVAAKLLLAIAMTAAITLSIFATDYYRSSSRAIEQSVSHDMARTGLATARFVSTWFEGRRFMVALTNEIVAGAPSEEAAAAALRRKVLVDNFIVTYVGRTDGTLRFFPLDQPLPPGYDPRNRPWYQAAVSHGRAILTEPYLDTSTGAHVVTLAMPFYAHRRLMGVTGADFSLTVLADMLGHIDLDGPGQAFIVDANGKIIVHANPHVVGKTVAQLFDGKTLPLNGAISIATEAGQDRLVRFTPIGGLPSAHWYVGVAMDEHAIYANLVASRRKTAASTAGLSLFALLAIWLVLRKVALDPLQTMTGAMTAIADRKFDAAVRFEERADEIGNMARAVEVFRANGLKIEALSAAEAAQRRAQAEARAAMVAKLQHAFGEVVSAAVAGDFTRRVADDFPDAELNVLARSVNHLLLNVEQGLGETGTVLAALARTDLTARISGDHAGAFAKLKRDTNAVADRLSEVIGQAQSTSRHLITETDSLMGSAEDLSDRTATQAAAIQKTTLAIAELTSAVNGNAVNAEFANSKAREAGHAADESGKAMGEAIEAMQRLELSSDQISSIIVMIDEIASHTSLVALNASIEAARVGPAGRSFAVVADEVRTLAQRAARASSDAQALIGASTAQVRASSAIVDGAATQVSRALAALGENSELLDVIAKASRQQAVSIEALSSALRQIDQVTRHNAQLAEGLDGATKMTKVRAGELDQIVEMFHLGGIAGSVGTGRGARPWMPPPRRVA